MATHSFNFEGGDRLSCMSATWFVSYMYYKNIDNHHLNWGNVDTTSSRISTFNKTKQYHIFWLKQVLDMNPNQLDRNTIGVDPETTKEHARELLSQCMKQEEASSLGQKEKDIIKSNNNKTIIRSLGDEWHKNCKYRKVDENILNRDWWKTATPEDVLAEIKKGADVNAVYYYENFGRRTEVQGEPLSLAVIVAENLALEYKSAKKSSLNITQQDIKASEDNIHTLLKCGADINNISDEAMENLFLDTALNVLNILIEAGLDVNKKVHSYNNETLINVAAKYGQGKIVKRLLDAGAKDTRTFMEKIKTYIG